MMGHIRVVHCISTLEIAFSTEIIQYMFEFVVGLIFLPIRLSITRSRNPVSNSLFFTTTYVQLATLSVFFTARLARCHIGALYFHECASVFVLVQSYLRIRNCIPFLYSFCIKFYESDLIHLKFVQTYIWWSGRPS